MKLSTLARPSTILLVPLLILPILSGMAGSPTGSQVDRAVNRLRVSASIYPITMLVRELGGERVSVTTLMPPGADPHHFELTPSGAKALHESRIIFMIGADFDSWLIQTSPQAGAKKELDSPEAGPDAARVRHVDSDEPHSQLLTKVELHKELSDSLIALGDTFNPHIWLDPLLAKEMGRQIGLNLIRADHANRAYYEERMARFAARVDSLHTAVEARLKACGFKEFVSFHPAWTYFARRYGLAEVAVVEKYPEHEPSARWVANLISEMERQGVGIMIVEATSDPGVVRGIANDTGVEVLTLDPIGDPYMPGLDTYFGLIDHNVSLVERAATGD